MRRILRRSWGTIDRNNEESTDGKTIIVTGANNGIGKATVAEILTRNTNVSIIMACRNMKAADLAVGHLQKQTTTATLTAMEMDLADLDSVRKFAEEFKSKYDKLDILINNAGVHLPASAGKQRTKQGFEMHFGVNHLGHFLLTNLLLEPLKKAAPSRVVTISSSLMMEVTLDFSDLQWEKRELGRGFLNPAYSESKLANMMFTEELSRRLESSGVHTYAVCPGLVNTDMGANLSPVVKWMTPILGYFVQSPAEGCLTSIYCALSKAVEQQSGQFYRKCAHFVIKYKSAPSKEDMERLWTESEKVVGLV